MSRRRNLAKEYRQTIDAQLKAAPQLFESERMFQPLYQSLNLQNLDYLLNGSPEQEFTYYDWNKPVWSDSKNKHQDGFGMGAPGMGGMPDLFGGGGGGFPGLPGMGGGGFPGLPGMGGGGGGGGFSLPGLGDLFGGDDDDNRKLLQPGHYSTRTVTRGPQRGLLRMMEEDVLPSQIRQNTQQRAGDIADVERLGPDARRAIAAASPESARLLSLLQADAQEGLELGATLDPSLRREVAQSVRAGQAARGMGKGPVDLYTEALETGSAAEALRATRRANAGTTIGLDQQLYGNMFQNILNRSNPQQAQGAVNQASGVGGQSGPQLFNPESAYASDLFNTNFNAHFNELINRRNNQAALIGAGINAVGNIAGSFI